MKNLKRFNLNSDYNNYIQSENVILPNVSFVKDENKVYYKKVARVIMWFLGEAGGEAEEGMTWEEFCNSKYAKNNHYFTFEIKDNYVYAINYPILDKSTPVLKTDVIKEYHSYTLGD